MGYLLTATHPRTLTRRQLSPREQPTGPTGFQDEEREEADAPAEEAGDLYADTIIRGLSP